MIRTEGLTLHYGGSQILHGIDLEARAGEVTCIMGTNGVGKTSLLKALAGTHPRSGGKVWLDGQDLGRLPAHEIARRGLAVVPQGRMIFPLLTVRENLETGLTLRKGARTIDQEVYDLFPVLKDMGHRRGGDLSGGQQQQLAIARAMLLRPKVLLLDEPTEGIQPSIIQAIGRVIDYLKAKGDIAIVLVEQYLEFAWDRGDRFIFLRRGQVSYTAARAETSLAQLRQAYAI